MDCEPVRHLVIVHSPGCEAESDWISVKQKIENRAPDIEVRIANNMIPSSVTRRWQIRRPSLVFSVNRLNAYQPAGGTIYAGRRLNKLKQFERLTAAALPMPHSVLLEPGLTLDPAIWGEYVIVKPAGTGSSGGQHVRLVRTETVGTRFDELTLGQTLEMIVQKYVDATDKAGRGYEYRVLIMFERPIYMLLGSEVNPRASPDEIVEKHDGAIAFNRRGAGKRELRLIVEDDVLDLARQTADALREFACLGLDIARDRATGRLYVLETNSGGFIWHVSSRTSRNYPREVREGIYTQFSALDTAADALIEKTREEAS